MLVEERKLHTAYTHLKRKEKKKKKEKKEVVELNQIRIQ